MFVIILAPIYLIIFIHTSLDNYFWPYNLTVAYKSLSDASPHSEDTLGSPISKINFIVF